MKTILKYAAIAVLLMVLSVLVVTKILPIIFDHEESVATNSSLDLTPIDDDATAEEICDYAKSIIVSLKNREYSELDDVTHPDYGVVFSPYATVNLSGARCFTATQISGLANDGKKYIWGVYDGGSEPIELTVEEYFKRFVMNVDFTKCEDYAVDHIIRTGNSLENSDTTFPDSRFVDCYMPDPEDEVNGLNWCSLRLVFEEHDGKLMLSAVIHSENTV